MLDYLEFNSAADRIRHSVRKVIGEGKVTTPDLGGKATTTDYTSALIEHL
jgi:isocitrate dehydrogenase (NAD+)